VDRLGNPYQVWTLLTGFNLVWIAVLAGSW
jgi:hypothetical protein